MYDNQIINTSNLKEGVYFVVINQNNIPVSSRKLIIIKSLV